jgi:archaeosine-15-forming tRNA-guanine transglycosylase
MTHQVGDKVRSVFKPDNLYVVLKAKNGWLTVRCADQLNSDLVFPKMRSSVFQPA